MFDKRSAGILLHPTSLPGPFGIGDLGPQTRIWIDFLAETGTSLWQILPLGPTGYGDSPYQSFSTFAGNPYLINPELLLEQGIIHQDDLVNAPEFPSDYVDYGKVIWWKFDLLNRAFAQFEQKPRKQILNEFNQFIQENQFWLDDFGIFMAIKESQGNKPWVDWSPELRDRNKKAIETFRQSNSYAIRKQFFFQFLFSSQWASVKKYANKQGIKIIGDIPIYIAHDSADAWVHKELLYLDQSGNPTVVAGVPPDYFSETGQLWGNPLYNWEVHARDGYEWWLDRLRSVLDMVDIIRLDHFRGFAGYWEIPASDKTAENGRWVTGPGAEFFQAVKAEIKQLPIIAEDLGEITPDVIQLRDQFELPGMKVLVFAFDSGEEDEFLPHHYSEDCVVYTGTHDNDTVVGWFKRIQEGERSFAQRYLQTSGEDIAWDLIKAAWSSKAVFAIAPMQDLLGLDNSARMNYPGNLQGNWGWRFHDMDIDESLVDRLSEVNYLYGRSQ